MSPFRKKKKKESESKEKAEASTDLEAPSMYVRFIGLTGLMDVTSISEEIRKGNMVVMDVSPLIQSGSESKLQLKRAVDQLRAVCFSVDGDIGQLGNRYILLTPTRVKIWREAPPEETGEKS